MVDRYALARKQIILAQSIDSVLNDNGGGARSRAQFLLAVAAGGTLGIEAVGGTAAVKTAERLGGSKGTAAHEKLDSGEA